MQQEFYQLADDLTAMLTGNEVMLCTLGGEDSDFVRFNHALVRQAGSVSQKELRLELVEGRRHAKVSVSMTGAAAQDLAVAGAALRQLRDLLPSLPEDPYLLYATEVRGSEVCGEKRLPVATETTAAILQAARGRDFVGLYAGGAIFAGFANSLGQRNWFSSHSFNLDWSLYHRADKAVKTSYAGFAWDGSAFEGKMRSALEQLEILARPDKTIDRGEYRVYLAPAALGEFVGMAAGGFGLKSHRTKTTPMLRMVEEGATLAPAVTLTENTREGIAPNFTSMGFMRPDSVTLVRGGWLADPLVSPRSAQEYGQSPNCDEGENPDSLDMAGGEIDEADVLSRLGEGLYINHLHYLNYSDVPACRVTGMTRFATFWVEGGRIVAPLNVMRFDETAFRVLGENLLGLTRQRDFIPSSSTYGGRSTSSQRVPGALVQNFLFTL